MTPATMRTIVAGLSAWSAATVSAQVSVRLIAVTGDPAPGMSGLTFAWLSGPRVNDAGMVGFAADLAGAGVTSDNDGSVWTDRSGTLELVARNGQAAPDSGAALFSNLPLASLSADGTVGLAASLIETGIKKPTEVGLYAEDASLVLGLVARDSGPATVSLGAFSAAGRTAFLVGGGDALWSNQGGTLSQRAAAGDPAPGMDGQVLAYLGDPSSATDGAMVFRSSFAPTPQEEPAGYGVWTETDGAVTLVVRTGDPAPGIEDGVTFAELTADPAPGIASGPGGRTVFWARLEGPGVTADSDTALFAATPSGLSLVAREGAAAPGAAGATFSAFSRHIGQTAAGTGFAVAYLKGDGVTEFNNSALYRLGEGSIATIAAREGDPAPGMPAEVVFATFSDALLGAGGHAAVLARVRGTGSDKSSNLALYLVDPAGALTLAARSGDSFDIRGDGSDLRVITEILLDGEAPGSGRQAITPGGTLAFKLEFADRSHALFTATPAKPVCKPDCNGDGKLNINDFICFQSRWRSRDAYGDYDASGTYTINDFIRFQADFARGCE